MRVYESVAKEMVRLGVDTVFGLMGEDTAKLLIELDRLGVRFIATRHENQAVGAADAYSRVSGKVGVAAVTSGPGFTNALTLITTASRAGSRVVVIVGAKSAHEDEPGYKLARRGKYFPYLATCAAEGISALILRDPATAVADTSRAFETAAAGETVVLNAPVDVLEDVAGASDSVADLPAPAQPRTPDLAQVELIADLLEQTWTVSRPLILAGRGAVWSGSGPALGRIGGRIGAGLTTTLQAVSLFAGEEFNLGICGTFSNSLATEVITRSDLVLVFGASLHTLTTYGQSLFRQARVIQVDADESAFGRYLAIEPELRIHADVRLTAEALLTVLEQRDTRLTGIRTPELQARIDGFDPTSELRDQSVPGGIDPRVLMWELDRMLPRDRVVVVDPGHHLSFSGRYLTVARPQDFVMLNEAGSIGVGVGGAIGAAVAGTRSVTVLGIGDAGLMMALGDVETAVRYHLPIVIVACNDRALGAEVHFLAVAGQPTVLATHTTPSFAAVAQALGAEGHTVTSVDDLRNLKERLARPTAGPIVIDCYVNPDIRGEWVELMHSGRARQAAPTPT